MRKKSISERHADYGLNDLLSYLMLIDPSTVLHKDGALSRHFHYVAPDLHACSDSELDYHATTWAKAFDFLGDGWLVETNLVSQGTNEPPTKQNFPEPVSELIENEWRNSVAREGYFVTHYYLSLTWKPGELMERRMRRFSVDSPGRMPKEDGFMHCLERFNHTVGEYIDYIKRALCTIHILKGGQLVTYLHQCINGTHHKLAQPYEGAFLDCYVAGQDFIGGFEPKVGNYHIKVLTLDELPNQSHPCILNELSHYPVSYRWSTRFFPLTHATAHRYLKRYERSWSTKAIGMLGVLRESFGLPVQIDEDAQRIVDQLKEAQVDNASRSLGYGFYNSILILMHKSKTLLKDAAEQISAMVQKKDFRIREEHVNAVEGYLGSIPGHGGYNLRKMLVDTGVVSHTLPISAPYLGEPKSPCPLLGYKDQGALLTARTLGAHLFYLNLHINDVGHTAILGPTGSGKSTLVAKILLAHRRYPKSRIIVFDKNHSNRLVIQSLGGQYFDLDRSEYQIAPLARVSPDAPEQLEKAFEWLGDCCHIQGIPMNPTRQQLLRDALQRLAQEQPEHKTLSYLALQDPELREAINNFNSGQFKSLLNGIHSKHLESDIIGFEMGALVGTQTSERDRRVLIIKAIFNELEERFRDRRPTLLILEEAWLYLKHPLFREKLADWFKTLRKYNVSVVFVSQDLDDIVRSDAASSIQTACMTRIYLPNPAAKQSSILAQYQAFGLNEQQVNTIVQSTPKQDYYYQSPLGHAVFRLYLGPIARSFLCVSNATDLERFDSIYQSDSPSWVSEWLNYQGVCEEAKECQ